jgi:asparagine synthase (glutamine-hydrolysing)
MCGIAGWVSAAPIEPQPSADLARRQLDHILRRGPDGSGQAIRLDGRLGFVHARLAIIDPQPRSNQPFEEADSGALITFNGEIYNFRALRTELAGRGVEFETESDTEVVLKGYLSDGLAFLGKLRGMYAFVLFDPRSNTVIAMRDHLGIKPLYFSRRADRILFGSSPAAAAVGLDPTLDPAAAVCLAVIGAVLDPLSPYKEVVQVPPGVAISLRWAGDGLALEARPIEPIFPWAGGKRAGGLGALGAALADAVSAHFTSDVPVAIFQSAGLDSTLLATLAKREGFRPTLLTIGFDEFRGTPLDEVPGAADVARRLQLDHRFTYFSRSQFEDLARQFLKDMPTPTEDGFNTYLAAWLCRKEGFKVALSGVGGDEIFAGYPSFRQLPALNPLGALSRLPGAQWLMGKASESVWRANPRRSPKLKHLAAYLRNWNRRYLFRRACFVPEELDEVLTEDVIREGLPGFWAAFDALSAGPSTQDAAGVRRLEMDIYMRNVLLRDADWVGMAHGVEVRTPFVDLPLLRQLCDRTYQCAYRKDDLRRLAQELDPRMDLSRRIKTGFIVPHNVWSVGDGQPEADPLTFGSTGARAWNRRVSQHWFGDWATSTA